MNDIVNDKKGHNIVNDSFARRTYLLSMLLLQQMGEEPI